MGDKRTWLVTGAGRGLGADIARAALAAGHRVVGTGRNPDAVRAALGEREDLLVLSLDITDPVSIQAAVDRAVSTWGGIDVLVNSAADFVAGFFEEIRPEDFRAQLETGLFGPLAVTRAVLPGMRAQRSGHVVTISSSAGLIGQPFVSAYAAAKFGIEGWGESVASELAPFGIGMTVVEPGFLRTGLLTPGSTRYAEPPIDDYADTTRETIAAWNGMDGTQGGDPAKLARALVGLVDSGPPPLRWVAGTDAVAGVEQKAHDLLAQVAVELARARRRLVAATARRPGSAPVPRPRPAPRSAA
ncbi:MAG: short-chain dehydrogenase/reductase [Frankiales bacterium]|jgi:NAD(P)-dependent dehydrogenase (short-subunit alcohol dehydrogenase family)|nr:short-chain dehydrogenase/reductase [Frankiales bacterium]